MLVRSNVLPVVSIDYYRPAPCTASGFCFVYGGNAVSMQELRAAVPMSDVTAAKLRAEAYDLTWPLGSGLVAVTVKHEHGQYVTDCNRQVGRVGIVDHFYGVTLGIILGRAGEDEDGTPCLVTGLEIKCSEGFTV